MTQNGPESDSPAAGSPGTPIQVRPVALDDGRQIHALVSRTIATSFPPIDRWLSLWRWRCWDNPYRGDLPVGWVLTVGEQVLGHLGAVYVPMRLGQERTTGVIGVDYAVAAEAARAGAALGGLRLAEAFFASAERSGCLAVATTANEQTATIFGRFGCQAVSWTRELWRAAATPESLARACMVTRGGLMRRLLAGRSGPAIWRLLRRCRGLPREPSAPTLPPGCRLETTVPKLAGDLGWLWEGLVWDSMHEPDVPGQPRREDVPAWPKLISIDRTKSYLEWRYGRHPEHEDIRVLTVRDQGGLVLGAAVVFLEDRGAERVALVEELIVLPHQAAIMRPLLCAALKLAVERNCAYLLSTPGRLSFRHVFAELGFEPRLRPVPTVLLRRPAGMPECVSIDDSFVFWHGEMF